MKEIVRPSQTVQLLKKHGFAFKKSLGQNFIIDPHILDAAVAAAELDRRCGVLEIGPGIGALTEQLAKRAGRVVAVEIDQRLLPILEESLQKYNNVALIHGDILKVDVQQIIRHHLRGYDPLHVVANLPYYVTTPILFHLLESGVRFKHLVLMVQKEVAERMRAQPGSKAYGALSVAIQYYAEPQLVRTVPRTVFLPQPKVDSSLIRLTLRSEPPVQVADEALLFRIVRACFHQRRKTVLNNLLHSVVPKERKPELLVVLAETGIDPDRRGETLSLAQFARLADRLRPLIS